MTTQESNDLAAQRRDLLEALPRLRRFARSLTGNRQDGDDLMQNTVERALQRGWPSGVEPLAWLFKVCKNLWIDELRARAVRVKAAQTRELDEEPTISGEEVVHAELGLRAAQLGLLTSAYLLAFALFQLPLGVLLGRFGPRRVQAALLACAAAGSLLFAIGQGMATLALARALIGLGFAAG